MLKWSARTWVLGGFAISLASVVMNTFVLARLNLKLTAVSGEASAVKESLNRMALDYERAESRYEVMRVLHWLAQLQPEGESRENAATEASAALANYLSRSYAAMHDIPVMEVVKTDLVENEAGFALLRKVAELGQKIQATEDPKERERLTKEMDAVTEAPIDTTPKSELGKTFAELAKLAESEIEATNEYDILLMVSPKVQEMRTDFIKTYEAKEARLRELEAEKLRLAGVQTLTSSLAIGLQLLGLFFILSRDIVKDIVEQKKKAASAATPTA